MRRRNEKHLQFIRGLPCLKCLDSTSTEATHLRRSDARIGFKNPGIGQKSDDRFVLPLCGKCHRFQHQIGEDAFWKGYDPLLLALALYSISGDRQEAERIIHILKPG